MTICAALLVALLATGTIGFLLTNPEKSVFDAAYLTLIILTTVGMEAAEGPEKSVAVFLMMGGIFTTIYAAGSLVSFFIDGDLQTLLREKAIKRNIMNLRQHFIIVGFGRMGQALAFELREQRKDFVVIEKSPDRCQQATTLGYLVVSGDAHEEQLYHEAGIAHAAALATCLPNDADNVFVALTARGLNDGIRIIARAEHLDTRTKLSRAGANRIVCPPVLCANKVTSMLLHPDVEPMKHSTTISADTEIQLFSVPISDLPALVDSTIGEHFIRARTGMTILSIDRGNQRELNPDSFFSLKAGDQLTLAGPKDGMTELKQLFGKKGED